MQKTNTLQFFLKDIADLSACIFTLSPGERVFLYGDLGAGKTTFIRTLLRHHFQDPSLIVRSPTYTYYQVITSQKTQNIPPVYHFDLYRLEDIEGLYAIGGMELIENPQTILLFEWPDMLTHIIRPTVSIHIRLEEDGRRSLTLTRE